MRVINPIWEYTLFVCFAKKRATMDPNKAIGTASSTEKGTDQLSYKAVSSRKTKRMDRAKISALLLPAWISWREILAHS